MQNHAYHRLLCVAIVLMLSCGSDPNVNLPQRNTASDMMADSSVVDMGLLDAAIVDASVPDMTLSTADQGMLPDATTEETIVNRVQCGPLTYAQHSLEDLGNDHWTVEGVTNIGNGQTGRCGGLGTEALIRFKIPTDGFYTMVLRTDLISAPVLHIRTDCNIADAEILCNEGVDAGERAMGTFEAAEGDVVFAFADSWSVSAPLYFSLDIFRHASRSQPTISSAYAKTSSAFTEVKLVAEDPNGDFVAGYIFDIDDPLESRFAFNFDSEDFAGRRLFKTLTTPPLNETVEWHVKLTDQSDLESESYPLEFVTETAATAGDPCGRSTPTISECAVDQACSPTIEGQWVCALQGPPSATNLRISSHSTGYFVSGDLSDPNGDLSVGILDIFDAQSIQIDTRVFSIEMNAPQAQLFEYLSTPLALEANTAILTLRDEYGNAYISESLNVGQMEPLQVGSRCNLDSFREVCTAGTVCVAGCENGDATCDAAYSCLPTEPIRIQEARVIRNTLRNRFVATVRVDDPQRIFSTVRLEDALSGSAILPVELSAWTRIDDTVLTSTISVPAISSLASVETVRVVTLDQWQQESDAIIVDVDVPETLEPARACDPTDATQACADGHACYSTQDTENACRPSIAPSLNDAGLFVREDLPYAGLRIVGQSGDADVDRIQLRIRPDQNQPSMQTYQYSLSSVGLRNGAFELRERIPLDWQGEDMQFMEIALIDARFQVSDWLPVSSSHPPQLAENDACYADQIYGACSGQTYCQLAAGQAFGLCLAGSAECNPEWTVQEIQETDDQSSTFDGDTRLAYSPNTGDCNPEGVGVMHRFIPTSSQTYALQVRPVGSDPLRFPRTAVFSRCEHANSQTACRNTPGLIFSGEAGIPVYLAVSSSSEQGTYELDVYNYASPTVVEGTIATVENSTRLDVDLLFSAGSEEVKSAMLRVLDEDGIALSSFVYGDSWNQNLSFEPAMDGVRSQIEVDLVSFDMNRTSSLEIRLVDTLDGMSDPFLLELP